jgi:hypothetical protein
MTLSEWNTCLPNEYSLEGTGLMAAYGLLQGWDGPLQFSLSGGTYSSALGRGSFNMHGNPPQILQYPAVMTMWHRRDVAEGPIVAETLYTPETLFEYAEDRRPLPLAAACIGKVGFRFVEEDREPVVRDISDYWDPENLTARSVTGQLTWNAKDGVVSIDTPRTAGAIGFLSAAPVRLRSVELTTTTPFGALYVTSLEDEKPVTQALRLLVSAVGPARNTGMAYETTGGTSRQFGTPMWHLAEEGTAPIMLRAIVGELRIRSAHADALSAWALDINGKRRMEVPLRVEGGAVVLPMGVEHAAVYYEVATE